MEQMRLNFFVFEARPLNFYAIAVCFTFVVKGYFLLNILLFYLICTFSFFLMASKNFRVILNKILAEKNAFTNILDKIEKKTGCPKSYQAAGIDYIECSIGPRILLLNYLNT